MIDRYIVEGAVENQDYEICSTEIWQFLSSKFGFDFEVRRYYFKGQY